MITTNSRPYTKTTDQRSLAAVPSPLTWAVLGGLAGTLVMDLVLMAALWLAGRDPFKCFSMVGMSVRLLLGLPSGEGLPAVLTGVATHYSVGPALAILFVALMGRLSLLRSPSLKRTLITAALYAELISQPMLVIVPIFLRLPTSLTLVWYAGSTVMHLTYAIVLGLTLWYGHLRGALRFAPASREGSQPQTRAGLRP